MDPWVLNPISLVTNCSINAPSLCCRKVNRKPLDTVVNKNATRGKQVNKCCIDYFNMILLSATLTKIHENSGLFQNIASFFKLGFESVLTQSIEK